MAGVALGLVLLGTFLVVGRGLGASGALTRITAKTHERRRAVMGRITTAALGGYFAHGAHWWDDWLVFEVVGVVLGGLVGGLTSGRFGLVVEAWSAAVAARAARLRVARRRASWASARASRRAARAARPSPAARRSRSGAGPSCSPSSAAPTALAYFVRRLWT